MRTRMTSGSGIFFDGNSSARQEVMVELAPADLVLRSRDGQLLAQWPYAELDQVHSPDQVLRLGRGRESLARLEIRDPVFAAAIDDKAAAVDRTGGVQRRMSMKVAALVVVAAASIGSMALFALPTLAARLTPLLPFGVERKLGQAVDAQLRASLGSDVAGTPLECGEAAGERPGRAALSALVARLEAEAALPMPLRAGVMRRKEPNAIALPGGQIYVFEGLIAKAQTPDELAGVIAHELGHVARRDGVKALLETAGLSFLFGMLFGDFVGGGAIVIAARSVLQSSYSRETEAAADAYAVALMNRVGGKAEALGFLLSRIDALHGAGPAILRDHPHTAERVASIRSLAKPGAGRPLLDDVQWASLKNVCAER
jgi:Zn-dependent protease with chaperone function